jgi:hypothetical protein
MCLGNSFKKKGSRPSSHLSLNISFWNIHGFKSRITGNKLIDPDFLSEVQKSDIIGLGETHVHDEIVDSLNIPGFVLVKYKNRKKQLKANKTSGGIAIFVKENLQMKVQPVCTENQDIVWLKINKENAKLANDIYIGTLYLSPHKGKITESEKIKNLAEDIIYFKGKGGDIILQGDFNARTSNNTDFVESDKFDTETEIQQPHIIPRNSKDKFIDGRGRELLDLCKSLDLNILNGRNSGDIFGDFTSFQWNGNSLIDYVITSQILLQCVLTFKVGNFIPWISDHCALHYTIQTQFIPNSPANKGDLYPHTRGFYWDETSSEKFTACLKSAEISDKLKNILDINNADTMATEINNILNLAATKSKIKLTRQKPENFKTNAAWYDKECSDIKTKINLTAKLIKKSPHETKVRESLYILKKQYKDVIKKKKKAYKENIIKQLNCTKKNTKIFWKLLDKLKPKREDDTLKSGISGNRWLNHFKSIFTSDKTFSYPTNPHIHGPLDYTITNEELNDASYVLKPGKSPGIDNISNEMILCLLQSHPDVILNLFNAVLLHNAPINTWNTSLINPIHKKGSKMDPSNYRGISLLCCLSKFFTAILNQRLLKYVLQKQILSKEQLGFIPGNRTSDALLLLHNLVYQYCKTNNKYIYACFVDFQKAFDSVPRHKLFEKLINYNITGKFYECIKNLYTNDLSCIKIGSRVTDKFQNSQGVKQGCILSPLLFNIFLADLPKTFQEDEELLKLDENETLWTCS